jgi:hypothetical protein
MPNYIKFLREHGNRLFDGKGNKEIIYELYCYRSHGWLIEIYDKDELVAMCCFKINDDTVKVITVVIHKDYQKKDLLRRMLLLGLQKYPQVRYIEYSRRLKKRQAIRKFDVRRFLNVKEYA